MWTPTTRQQHSREHLRYETDLTDCRVGSDRASHARPELAWGTSGVASSRDHQRDLLRVVCPLRSGPP